MQLAENTVVADRFRLSRLLGRGGMGVGLARDAPRARHPLRGQVHRGRDRAASPRRTPRFEREAKAAAQLRSPHVVQILDHGVCEGTPYIAMELLDGEDLGKRLAAAAVACRPAELPRSSRRSCRALTKAHALGHRPPRSQAGQHLPRARRRPRDRQGARLRHRQERRANALGGQQHEDRRDARHALLHEPGAGAGHQARSTTGATSGRSRSSSTSALTGVLPFESEALGDLLMKIIVMALPMPSQHGCTLPGLDGWWRKAAARDPAQRFQSAKELGDSLALVCGVSQMSGVHDRPPMMMPGPTGTLALKADGSPAVAEPPPHAATHPDAVTGATPPPMARTFADATGEPPKKSAMPLVAGGGAVLLAIIAAVFVFVHSKANDVSAASAASAEATTTPPAASALPATAPATATAAPPSTESAAPSAPGVPGTGAPVSAAPPSPPPPSEGTTPKAAPPPKASPPKSTPRKPAAPADLGF